MTRLLLAALLLTAIPAQAKPALWRFGDADTTVWLFGTVHALPKMLAWGDPELDAAIGQADRLVLEVVLDDPAAIAADLARLGRGANLPPLIDRVPADRRMALVALMARAGLPAGALDGYETWAAAMLLAPASLAELGLAGGADGVETVLTRRFRAAAKPIAGLETAADQFAAFDGLPEAAQRVFLTAMLDDPAKGRREFADLLAAWVRGDLAAIERAFADDPEFTPALRDALLRRRNALWTAALVRALERPGTMLVAVGAGHLVGSDAVQAMLAARGIKVRRVR